MAEPPRPPRAIRLVLMRELRRWHWIASALCLAMLLMFAATGLTLNHAGTFEPEPRVTQTRAIAPAEVQKVLAAGPAQGEAPLPPAARAWLDKQFKVRTGDAAATWSAEAVELVQQRPGGQTTTVIDRPGGQTLVETEARGLVAAANDLHTGRYSPKAWNLLIDVFAVACLVFAGTGLGLLLTNARARPVTWPLILGGVAIPLGVWLIAAHAL